MIIAGRGVTPLRLRRANRRRPTAPDELLWTASEAVTSRLHSAASFVLRAPRDAFELIIIIFDLRLTSRIAIN